MDLTSSCRVILAEDNAADVRLVREALREHDVTCDLHILSDGQEVMEFIDRLDADQNLPCPDLLLLDMFLPKYDGRQILEHLRASERCARTPVVVMTSSDWRGHREMAEKNEALYYFRKPVSLGQFLQLGRIVKTVIAGGWLADQGDDAGKV